MKPLPPQVEAWLATLPPNVAKRERVMAHKALTPPPKPRPKRKVPTPWYEQDGRS